MAKKKNPDPVSKFEKLGRSTKTNHKMGYHKPVKNPTTNMAPDSHHRFCKRCMTINGGCPITGTHAASDSCNL